MSHHRHHCRHRRATAGQQAAGIAWAFAIAAVIVTLAMALGA